MKCYNKRNAVGVTFKVRKDGCPGRARNRYRKSWMLKNVTFALTTESPTHAPPHTELRQTPVHVSDDVWTAHGEALRIDRTIPM